MAQPKEEVFSVAEFTIVYITKRDEQL